METTNEAFQSTTESRSYHSIESLTSLNALAGICEIIQFNADELGQP